MPVFKFFRVARGAALTGFRGEIVDRDAAACSGGVDHFRVRYEDGVCLGPEYY